MYDIYIYIYIPCVVNKYIYIYVHANFKIYMRYTSHKGGIIYINQCILAVDNQQKQYTIYNVKCYIYIYAYRVYHS